MKAIISSTVGTAAILHSDTLVGHNVLKTIKMFR